MSKDPAAFGLRRSAGRPTLDGARDAADEINDRPTPREAP